MSKVAIIMGSASDWDVMSPACTTLEEFGISYEKKVLSAHRNPGPGWINGNKKSGVVCGGSAAC